VFFADESGTSGDRFTVVGGLCVHKNTIPRVHRSIEEYRSKHNMRSELKWSKISNQKQEEYTRLVEYFFALNNTNHIQFHAVIFDSHQWNHKKYNNGDRDVGLSKLYYQLLLHKFAKICGPTGSLCACLDHRNSSTSLEDMRKMLNSTLASKHGLTSSPFKQLVSADSKLEDLLQLNDVILGAVNAVRNGKHLLADTRDSKKRIAQMVFEKSGLDNYETDSPKGVNRFTLWNMQPRT
jgi:hypothetical protein